MLAPYAQFPFAITWLDRGGRDDGIMWVACHRRDVAKLWIIHDAIDSVYCVAAASILNIPEFEGMPPSITGA